MTFKMRGNLAALACVLAAGVFVVPPQAAEAQTLMDLFRGGPRQAVPQREYRTEPAVPLEQQIAPQARVATPPPVVKGPQYLTYRPDAMKRVDFSGLFDDVTTGSVDANASGSPARGFAGAAHHLADMRIDALAEVADAVAAFYAERRDFVWIEDGKANAKAEAALRVLEQADTVGLVPADYRVRRPDAAAGSGDEARAREAIRFEMDLSAKALTYVLDATRGRIDPNRISEYHDFERKTVDLERALASMARSGDIATYLERRSPTHTHFQALKAEYERLQEAGEGERVTIAEGTLLRPGAESSEVPSIVAAIRARGSDALKTDHALFFADYDGSSTYTPAMVDLVKAFQKERGLSADGVVGRNTILAMTGMSNADKLDKVRLAMEQARWLNRDLGERHVFINVPSYRVSYVEGGEEKLNMRSVVGSKGRQTFFFQDEIDHVEFNPYWGVPQSIIVNDMIPKLRKDPTYLDRSGYEVTTQSGTRIASASIDWYSMGNRVPYNVRQRPGPRNSLGELKIMFPNRHAIYMHDTPDRHLFERDSRAYSSGCVRLEDPRAMAAAVLGTTRDDVAASIAGGQTKMEKVPEKFPVYIAYFTAWPNAEGEVQYFDDVYDRDTYLKRAMDATNGVRHADS
jgi:L,D-transpeptidase YcbB